MTILRSGQIIPQNKSLTKSPKTKTKTKTGPCKTLEKPLSTPPQSTSLPSSSSPSIRRSRRIASKSLSNSTVSVSLDFDSGKGKSRGSGSKSRKARVFNMDLNAVDMEIQNSLDPDSDSGKRNSRKKARVFHSMDMDESGLKETDQVKETTNFGNLVSNSGSRRKSERLAKAAQGKSVVDLNSSSLRIEDGGGKGKRTDQDSENKDNGLDLNGDSEKGKSTENQYTVVLTSKLSNGEGMEHVKNSSASTENYMNFIVDDSENGSSSESDSGKRNSGNDRRSKKAKILNSAKGKEHISHEEMDLDLKGTDDIESNPDREIKEDVDLRKLQLSSGSGGSRRRSQRLANAAEGKWVVDLNIPPSPSKFDDGSDKGSLDSPSGVGITKRKIEDAFKNTAEDRERELRLANETGYVIDVEKSEEEPNPVLNETNAVNGTKRYSREDKGKGLMVTETWLSIGLDPVDLDLKSEEENVLENAVSILSSKEDVVSGSVQLQEAGALERERQFAEERERQFARSTVRNKAERRREYRGRFLDIARERASHYAHFQHEEEDNGPAPMPENGEAVPEADQEIEDWPGPFSTAMKIIKDRTMNLNVRQKNSTGDVSNGAPTIEWTPSKDLGQNRLRPSVPSLQDMCLKILANNADAIVSLDNVPDVLKNKLCQLLCDSRRMDSHFMNLLASGSPTEIRVTDCSWMTEEQISGTFGRCDMKKLMVLQLDLCGHCMPDYILRTTLAQSPNSLTALVAISMRGACRVTDSGLSSLVAAAPALRSINLGLCSLITSSGVNTIADSLGSVIRELYLDDCQSIDAMLILPALNKLEHLEVLSVAGIQTVSNNFVCEFVVERGANLKELDLANCRTLTDISVKVISECCTGLRALNLVNLQKLTDSSVGYLANGCQPIQMLKLRCNAFSDEAIAAYLEASGEPLIELSLNNVKKVGHNTAISLARRCSRNLLHLDLSWCRQLADEALGLIVDSCLSLKVLKLFGCTHVTNMFLDGHSNPSVKIIGLKMTPILQCHDTYDHNRGLLRYSSVPYTEY